MQVNFDKMEGAGNDFVLIDNRTGFIPDSIKQRLVIDYCHRRFGVGADGMIFVETDPELDFSWDFYNSDGSRAEMCGNGARCVARFANAIGAAGQSMTFRSVVGPIKAELTERGSKVQMPDAKVPNGPATLTLDDRQISYWFLNTGVPHVVVQVEDLEAVDVQHLGAAIRYHPDFSPAGTNVNFVALSSGDRMRVRTYERGVEGETLACGTGCVASSIVAGLYLGKNSPITVTTRGGGELVIHYSLRDGWAKSVFLEGGARLVFSGSFAIQPEG